MKFKQVDSIVQTILIGAAVGCVFHYIWGTVGGALVGFYFQWNEIQTEKKLNKK